MHTCKVCGESIYQKMNYTMLFKNKAKYHTQCFENLVFNNEYQTIPIDGNQLIIDTVFFKEHVPQDILYFELIMFGSIWLKHIKNDPWSMFIIWDCGIELFMEQVNPYLIFSLSNRPIIILSMLEFDLSVFEDL